MSPQSSPDDRRRFRLLDAMVLVASVAVALAVNRALPPDYDALDQVRDPAVDARGIPLPYTYITRTSHYLEFGVQLATPHLLTLGLAVVLLGLRRPRPPWPRIARQPGFLAALSASLAGMLLTANTLALRAMPPSILRGGSLHSRSFSNQADEVGMVVAGAWLAVFVSGNWGRADCWVERLGRLVGIGWILAVVAVRAVPFTYR